MAKDLVCGMTVDDKAPLKSTYAGKNYVFCSASCKTKFDKEPGRYAPPCWSCSGRKEDLMHDGGWLGMGGMGSYWLVPALIVVLVVFAVLLVRRSREGR